MQACRAGVRATQSMREGAWTMRASGRAGERASGHGIERVEWGEQKGGGSV